MLENYLTSFLEAFLVALQVATSPTAQILSDPVAETHLPCPPSAGRGAGGQGPIPEAHSCSTQKYMSVKPFRGSVGSCLVSVFPSWPQGSKRQMQSKIKLFPSIWAVLQCVRATPASCRALNGATTPATVPRERGCR